MRIAKECLSPSQKMASAILADVESGFQPGADRERNRRSTRFMRGTLGCEGCFRAAKSRSYGAALITCTRRKCIRMPGGEVIVFPHSVILPSCSAAKVAVVDQRVDPAFTVLAGRKNGRNENVEQLKHVVRHAATARTRDAGQRRKNGA